MISDLEGTVFAGGARGTRTPDPLLAKEVTATAGPAAAQVKGTAGCSVSDRESPWVTLLTGTWRAWSALLAASPDHRSEDTYQAFNVVRIGPRADVIAIRLSVPVRQLLEVVRPGAPNRLPWARGDGLVRQRPRGPHCAERHHIGRAKDGNQCP